MKTAVIIPVYNHEKQIGDVIRRVGELQLPIFVVDDGSTDNSGGVAGSFPGITLLSHAENRGKGAAILTGLAAAGAEKCDRAITIDGDGQHNPEDIRALLLSVENGESCMVVGSRQGMDNGANVPWTSKFGRKFSNFWVWAAGGPLIEDSQSGFRLYPVVESLQLDVKARRYQFEVEILVKARQQGIIIKEAPVQVVYQPKGERVSHFRPWLDFWRNSVTFNRLIWIRLLRMLQP